MHPSVVDLEQWGQNYNIVTTFKKDNTMCKHKPSAPKFYILFIRSYLVKLPSEVSHN